MVEKDIFLRWLRSFSEGLAKIIGKAYVLEDDRNKEIDQLYQTFFGINRESFLRSNQDEFFEAIFNSDQDLQTNKEKIIAFCELIDVDMKFERNEEIKLILSYKLRVLKEFLKIKYGFELLDFSRL